MVPEAKDGGESKGGREATDRRESERRPTGIVGIGASAGGLAAIKRLFRSLPTDTGLAFVVVVHLSPEHESHLAELLQPHVPLPVQQVQDTPALEPDRVYIIPPGSYLETIDTHLRLARIGGKSRPRTPVDHFLRTLARYHDGHAVGIILSGTGSDGALGIREIKERGGLTIAQDPSESEYDGMPRSAIQTGTIDLVLPVDQILDAVVRFIRTRPRLPPGDADLDSVDTTRQLVQKIFAQLRARTGRDFARYKRSTVLRRIARRMQLHQIEDGTDYLERLRSDPDEARALADDLLITVTRFFRDEALFEKLEREVVPELFDRRAGEIDLRLWCVGCATGEEAFSLGILLLEEAARRDAPPQIQIFASDLHQRSLDQARLGYFPGDIEADVSPERLQRFFQRENGGYRVSSALREIIVFAPHNVLADPPFSRMDLISCRNLMIYLQRDAQEQVIETFHYALRVGGVLALGGSETISTTALFTPLDKKLSLHRKRDVPTPEARMPALPIWRGDAHAHAVPETPTRHNGGYGEMHARIAERYGPPSVLVAPNDAVVHLSEHAGRYLAHPGGEPTTNLLKLVHPELRIELRTALSEAREGRSARTPAVSVRFPEAMRKVVAHARPALDERDEGFVLVLFDERTEEGEDRSVARGARSGREQVLEADLERARQRMQATIEAYETAQEEMRASNEELQSANEELRSTMEEAETSKEELHSMNEELQTMNQEHRHKVEELAQLSSDLQNLLSATDIATLFLDRELRILRFTPSVDRIFNMRSTDRGRPLSDLTHRLGYDEILADAGAVLKRLIPVEREVSDADGRWYLTRLLPYRSLDDRIDGVVITFVDITARKQAEDALHRSEARLSLELDRMVRLHELVARLLESPDVASALEEVLEATMALAGAEMGSIRLPNASASQLEIAAHRGLSPAFFERFPHTDIGDGTPASLAWESGRRILIEDVEADPTFRAHRERAIAAGFRSVQSLPLVSRSGGVLGVLSTYYRAPSRSSDSDLRVLELYARQAADFIDRVRNQESLRETSRRLQEEDERKGFFLATLGHELRNPLAALDGALKAIREGAGDPDGLQSIMATQVARLKLLIDDLLEVSRITRGTLVLRTAPVDLVRVVRVAAESVAASIAQRAQTLTLPSGPSLFVDGDEARLEQIVSNLLSNASRYTPEGKRVEVELRRVGREGDEAQHAGEKAERAGEKAERSGEKAVLVVRDEGQGIGAENLERIFEPFVQLEPNGGGLGIGLPLVKHLVELHGGTIRCESPGRDRGTAFVVELPVCEAPPAAAPLTGGPAPHGEDRLAGSPRILIVDDVRDVADTLALLLGASGAEVRCAYDGRSGVEEASNGWPQVMLVDIGLPDMPGTEVGRRVRASTAGRSMLLVGITGFGESAVRDDALAAGFDEVLVKPVDQQQLEALIRRHVAAGA